MVFDSGEDGATADRYSTWDLAEAGHRRTVLRVRNKTT
jgi:hypothetical protein